MSRDTNWFGGGGACLFGFVFYSEKGALNKLDLITQMGFWCCERDLCVRDSSSCFTPFLCLRSKVVTASVAGVLELLPASLSPSILLPPPCCPSPGTKSSLYSQQQRLSHSIIPHTAPFYSQRRGTLAAVSQAWEEPTRSSRKPLVCTTTKESIHGTALSIHQGWFWDLIGGGRPFKREDFAHISFYLLRTRSVVEEVPQVLLRGGSRLGRAASRRARRGAGRCSRWPRRRARSHGAGTSRRLRLWRCPRPSLGSPARCWQSPWQR